MGTLNRQVCHLIQGTTFSNITMRGDYNSVDSATITLSELKQLVEQWITTDYIQSPHKGRYLYNTNKKMARKTTYVTT
ncbi:MULTISPECIES: hypothetical protein [Gilliamella]|uniref:Uncharacterized protein n=1 Tax=Gilliamella apicola TaxID=1196095 RepID=A0A556SC27_9GAMM|nr:MULTISPECIES: hypothetical protein [Gilliamella]MBI0095225.1 hypothetical protein [Gilliamella sp. W8136]TSJ98706.1 hypothetical protein FPQ15_07560 [Gilliamella apicola]